MKFVCPDKNSKEWKSLKDTVGLTKAYKLFIKNDYDIPIIEREINDEVGEALIEALNITTHRIKLIEASVKETDRADKELRDLKETEDKLVNYILDNNYKEGLLYFSQQMSADIEMIRENLEINTSSRKLKSSRVRSALTYIDSMLPIIDSITTFLVDKKDKDQQELEIFGTLSSKRAVLQKLREEAIESGRDVFATLIEPFLGDRNNEKMLAEINKNLPEGKKIKKFDLLTALKQGERDINLLDRWLKSMANTPDELLKLTNELVLRKKHEARLNAYDDKLRILDLREKYFKEHGGKDFDWVYEQTREGKLTGNFIDERRWTEYYRDMFLFKKSFLDKKGAKFVGDLTVAEREEYIEAFDKWKKDNSEYIKVTVIGGTKVKRIPSLAKYGNEDYQKLSAIEKEILEELKKFKEEMDSKLHPKFRNPHRVPQVSRDFFERMKDVKNPGQVRELVTQEFYDKDYDVDQGNKYNVDDATVEYVLSDRGREQNLLPMHFTKKLDNLDRDLSKDIISSMVLYSHMARDYEAMDDIVDSLEVAREILRERKTPETGFQGKLKKTISYVAGNRIESNLFKENSLAFQRFEDYLNMVVYGKTRIEGKTVKIGGETVTRERALELIEANKKDTIKINGKNIANDRAKELVETEAEDKTFKVGGVQFDREKAIDLLGKYTAINALALNLYSGIANIGYGETMLKQEAFSGRYFSQKDLTNGSINYWKQIPEFLSKHGNVHNTSKLSLWSDRFDTLQDYQSEKYQVDSMRRTWFSRSLKMSSLFFLNNAGEHFMQNRTSLALAQGTKVKDKNGNQISLYDAYEVKDGRLQLRQGITKLDGTEWTRDDEISFQRRQDFINQRMHGIYNQNDMAALQKYAVGRLALMFRKFIIPGWDRRWEKANYNYMLGDFTEGYYRSAGIFFGNIIKDLTHMKFSLVSNWKNLSDLRKQNMIKFMTEMGVLLSMSLLLTFFLGADDDGSDDWLRNMTEYQARRLITELMFFTNPNEAVKMLKSPMAAVTPIQNFIDFTGSIMNPLAWDDKLESGRYKDWYEWQRNSLKILPFYKTVDRVMHPEEAVRWWKQ